MAGPTTEQSAPGSARPSMGDVSLAGDKEDVKDLEKSDLGRVSTSVVGQSSGVCRRPPSQDKRGRVLS